MDLTHSAEKLRTFLSTLQNIDLIPISYSPLLPPFYNSIAENDELKLVATTKCTEIFKKWEAHDQSISHPESVQRFLDLWLVIRGKEYFLNRPLPCDSNLIIKEVEVNDYVDSTQSERLEFDPDTGIVLKSPLDNLIIEDVEVTEFIDSELKKK